MGRGSNKPERRKFILNCADGRQSAGLSMSAQPTTRRIEREAFDFRLIEGIKARQINMHLRAVNPLARTRLQNVWKSTCSGSPFSTG